MPGSIPIPALACSYATGIGLPSGHSYGYGLQSSPAPSGIYPAPYSGIQVQYAGWLSIPGRILAYTSTVKLSYNVSL